MASGQVDPVTLYHNDANFHISKDWGGGARANGIQYHRGVWEKVLYILRNPDSILWHCGSWPENASCRAYNVPISFLERASRNTLLTLAAAITEDNRSQGRSPSSTWGHNEVAPGTTRCPDSLIGEFCKPFRAGTLKAGPVVEPVPFERERYNAAYIKTPWTEPRVAFLKEKLGGLFAAGEGSGRIKWISQQAYEGKLGSTVCIVLGKKAVPLLSPDAHSVFNEYPKSQSDIWNGLSDVKVRDCLSEIVFREGIDAKIVSEYEERFDVPKAASGPLTLDQLTAIYDVLPRAEYERKLPGLNAAMRHYDITGPHRISAFLGNLAAESRCLKYVEEITSGSAYEGRLDLGNTQPGDGVRFKGRGYIQITGRANYTAASKALGFDFVSNPEAMEKPEWAAMVSGWFWNSRNLNHYADQGNAGWPEVCRRINGRWPANGQETRNRYYSRAWEVLKP